MARNMALKKSRCRSYQFGMKEAFIDFAIIGVKNMACSSKMVNLKVNAKN
jgi:hypothetical protein